jgi:hypothetical protein
MQCTLQALSLRVKPSEREVNYLPQTSVKINNAWRFTY